MTTTQTEALKLALEALETYHGYMEPLTTVFGGPRVPAEQSTTGKVETAITSLRQALEEALAKQEQCKPVGEMTPSRAEMFMTRFKHEEKMLGPNKQAALDYVIAMLVAKQEQGEPVAWQERQAKRMQDGAVTEWTNWYPCRYRTIDEAQAEACDHIPYEWRPLYTTPQQRKPLTDEELEKCTTRICGMAAQYKVSPEQSKPPMALRSKT